MTLDPTLILEVILNGVLLGGILALAAIGLSLVLGVTGVLNIMHGQFLVLAGTLSYLIHLALKLNPIILFIIIPPLFFLIGISLERSLIRPLVSRTQSTPLLPSILVTFGLALIVQDVLTFAVGDVAKGIPTHFPPLKFQGLQLPMPKLLSLFSVLTATLSLWFFLVHTSTGNAARAIIQDREGAMLCGIDIPRISMLIFGIGAALAGLAGVYYSIIYTVQASMGIKLTMIALILIALGGVGNILGTLVSGIIVGVTHTVVELLLGAAWSLPVVLLLFIAALLARPRGVLSE
jgi:branched-chain amino acid transport system permease protein